MDNRILNRSNFAGETASSAIKIRNLELYGKYVLHAEENKWLPKAHLLYAATSEQAQFLYETGAQSIPNLPKELESKTSCHGVNIISKTWRFINDGIENVLSKLSSTIQQKQHANPVNESGENKCTIVICTTDKALLCSAQDHTRDGTNAFLSSNEASEDNGPKQNFIERCSQLFNYVKSGSNPTISVNIHIICAMISRLQTFDQNMYCDPLSNAMAYGSNRSKQIVQTDVEAELTALCRELSAVSSSCVEESFRVDNQQHRVDIQLHALLPSPLLYEQQLRMLINSHVPKLSSTLAMPSVNNQRCNLKILVSASTIQGAEIVSRMKPSPGGLPWLGEFDSLVPRSGVPASCINGPGLSVQYVSRGGQKETLWKNNAVSFMALSDTLCKLDCLAILRIPRSGSKDSDPSNIIYSDFWALIPPAPSASNRACESSPKSMTLLRLVDRESVLRICHTGNQDASNSNNSSFPPHMTDDSPISSVLNIADEDGNLAELTEEDFQLYQHTLVFMQESLLTLGTPVLYNPLSFPTDNTSVALERASHQAQVKDSSNLGQKVASSESYGDVSSQQGCPKNVVKSFSSGKRVSFASNALDCPRGGDHHSSKRREISYRSSSKTSKKAEVVSNNSSSRRNRKTPPKVISIIESSSSDDSDTTSLSSTFSGDLSSSDDCFEKPVRVAAISSRTRSKPAKTNSKPSTPRKEKKSKLTKRNRGAQNKAERISTHAFASQSCPSGGSPKEEIEDSDEEMMIFD